MKYIMLVLLLIELGFSTNPRLIIEPAIIDNGTLLAHPGHGSTPQASIIIDSTTYFSIIFTTRECISYLGGSVDALCIVNRGWSPTGVLFGHEIPGDLSYMVDAVAYNEEYGPGRYPNAFAGNSGPYISFPYFISGNWGGSGANDGSGGWFAGSWDVPEDLGPGNQLSFLCILKELSNGNIMSIIGCMEPDVLQYRRLSNDLSQILESGLLTDPTRNCYYWGFDYNLTAGLGYIFYVDSLMNVYYRKLVNGSWSPESLYNLVWPNPYPNNEIKLNRGCQAVVQDNGQPMLVFSNMDADDLTYPQYGKVYVSPGSGQNCIEVSSTFGAPDTECFYSTIATSGNIVAVSYLTPRNDIEDSACWHDIHVTHSLDTGLTWSTPVNVTASNTLRSSFPQLAKRIDMIRNRMYILYATCMNPAQDMDLMWAYDAQVVVPVYLRLLDNQIHGIADSDPKLFKRLLLNVSPNPATSPVIYFTLPVAGYISLKLYQIDGRLVKILDSGHKHAGNHTANISDLTNGIYFVKLETPSGSASVPLVFLK